MHAGGTWVYCSSFFFYFDLLPLHILLHITFFLFHSLSLFSLFHIPPCKCKNMLASFFYYSFSSLVWLALFYALACFSTLCIGISSLGSGSKPGRLASCLLCCSHHRLSH